MPLLSDQRDNPNGMPDTFNCINIQNLLGRLQQNFSGTTIEAVADEVTKMPNGQPFRRLNASLNAWRSWWTARRVRDNRSDGKTFCADPLPLWQVAKLFIFLHITKIENLGDSDLKIPQVSLGDFKGSNVAQDRISSWLHRLQIEKTSNTSPINSATSPPDTLGGDENRVFRLMRPL